MNTKAIIDKIAERYTPLSNECQEELIANSTIKTFKKGEIVVPELVKDRNEIKITLNSNDHQILAVRKEVIQKVVIKENS